MSPEMGHRLLCVRNHEQPEPVVGVDRAERSGFADTQRFRRVEHELRIEHVAVLDADHTDRVAGCALPADPREIQLPIRIGGVVAACLDGGLRHCLPFVQARQVEERPAVILARDHLIAAVLVLVRASDGEVQRAVGIGGVDDTVVQPDARVTAVRKLVTNGVNQSQRRIMERAVSCGRPLGLEHIGLAGLDLDAEPILVVRKVDGTTGLLSNGEIVRRACVPRERRR